MTLIPDFGSIQKEAVPAWDQGEKPSLFYRASKRALDLGFCTIFLLPAMLFVLIWLLVLNPIYNPG
ncbi:MAG: hypothetical protein O3A97_09005, partial [Proteobacteria bacterium]|nr:hypothetical protein [Pseudomonadota bacterium]